MVGFKRKNFEIEHEMKKKQTLKPNRKNVGQKKPFTPDQVRLIRSMIEAEDNKRDLALFNCGIDTLLRAVDLLALTVGDVMGFDGRIRDEMTLQQRKTQTSLMVALSPQSQDALRTWIEVAGKSFYDSLFTRLKGNKKAPISTNHYRRLVKRWAEYAHLDSAGYSSHSMRRTKASLVYERTLNIEVVRQLLGHKSVASTSLYLGIGQREALDIAKKIEI